MRTIYHVILDEGTVTFLNHGDLIDFRRPLGSIACTSEISDEDFRRLKQARDAGLQGSKIENNK